MSIRKLRSGRVPGVTAGQYVGVHGSIFWNENTGELRLSDGDTPGGLRVGFPIASSTELGGIKLGPGVILNQNNQIIIDSEGLDFSFGNLTGTIGTYPADYYQAERQDHDYAVLGSINVDEDIVIASNGTGAVRVVGDFSVRRATGSLVGALEEEPVFRVISDGQVRMLVPSADSTEGAVGIIGGLDGVFQPPVNTGVMLHITGITGTPGIPSRIYNDSQNSFSAFVSRRYNNTAAAPTAVLDGEEIMRLSGTAHNGTSIPGSGNQRIVYKALGNQTLTNQGGTMEFWTTPINTTTIAKIATVDSVGITLESGKVLTGNVTGKADTAGNADTVTNGVYTTDTGTVTNTMLAGSIANNKLSNSSITVNGSTIALGGTATITAAAGTLTGTTLNSTVVTSSLTSVGTLGSLNVTNTVTAGLFDGINKRTVRSVGTVADGGTVTIDFATDDVVLFTWGNGVSLAYSNYTAGRLVKVIAKKATSTGTDSFSLDGLTAANVSTGTTTFNGVADQTYFIELICTNTSIGSVYAKV